MAKGDKCKLLLRDKIGLVISHNLIELCYNFVSHISYSCYVFVYPVWNLLSFRKEAYYIFMYLYMFIGNLNSAKKQLRAYRYRSNHLNKVNCRKVPGRSQ